jgi:hypothetical protein
VKMQAEVKCCHRQRDHQKLEEMRKGPPQAPLEGGGPSDTLILDSGFQKIMRRLTPIVLSHPVWGHFFLQPQDTHAT